MAKRIFAFGCSYTRHRWPTWADIMSWDQQVPVYNNGIPGIGNVGILHKMVECDIQHKFTSEDLVIVLWSSWNREDRYKDGRWLAGGNILTSEYYDKDYIKKYWSIENNIVKNSTAIITANKSFTINFQGHIAPIMSGKYDLLSESEQQLFDFYKESLPLDNVFSTTINDGKSLFAKVMKDRHPDVLEHLAYLKLIYRQLGLTLSPSIEARCIELQDRIIQDINPSSDEMTKAIQIREMVESYDTNK